MIAKELIAVDSKVEKLFYRIQELNNQQLLVKLIFANKWQKSGEFKKLVVSPFLKKGEMYFSHVGYSETQSFTKNHDWERTKELFLNYLHSSFKEVYVQAIGMNISFSLSAKGKSRYSEKTSNEFRKVTLSHNHEKKDWVNNNELLFRLGIINKNNKTVKGQTGKRRQINKFIELIDVYIRDNSRLQNLDSINIVDMGSGKAYLSFALYHHLTSIYKLKVNLVGVEIRKDLVDFCKQLAKDMKFSGMKFIESDIIDFKSERIDILLALHACNTATDYALYQGVVNKAELMFCSPCCHKEIRPQLKKDSLLSSITNYGIMAERQAELITDSLRALLLNREGYKTNIMEYVSTEHSGKNILITAEKKNRVESTELIQGKINNLKSNFGIKNQCLEQLLEVR